MLVQLSLLATALQLVGAVERGLAWAGDNRFAPTIGSKPLIKWYHHWEFGAVPEMPSKVEFVPMFWGAKKWDKWNSRKAEINKKLPKYLLGFNEPDIASQGNMNPDYAVQVWMQEIHPFSKKGVKLISPAIAWDLNWTDKFLKALAKKGGHVDAIAIHWYGSWKNLADFKKFVTAAHTRFGRDIWITELGITSASKPSAYDIKQFLMHAYQWLDTQPYVKRASWFGCFQSNNAPDAYATGKNALFKPGWSLNDLGYYYTYSTVPDRRREIDAPVERDSEDVASTELGSENFQSKHRRLAASFLKRKAEEDEEDDGEPPVDCDEICELRKTLYEDDA